MGQLIERIMVQFEADGLEAIRTVVREEVARGSADLLEARKDVERLQDALSTIDEAHRVLDEAGVDREDDEGHVMPLWDRVAGLTELVEDVERAEARTRAAEAEVKRLREQKPPAFVMRREVGEVAVEVRAPTLADLEAAAAALLSR